jgi:CRP-like cAMP-binding protein
MINSQDLSTIPLFVKFSDEEREEIASITTQKRFLRDSLIYRQTDPCGELFVIQKGEVKITRVIRENQGDIFGRISFIDGKEHTASAVSITDSVIFIINKTGFDKLAHKDPVLGRKMLMSIILSSCGTIRKRSSKIKDLGKYITSRG